MSDNANILIQLSDENRGGGDRDTWRLQYALPGAGEAGGFHTRDYDDRGWIAAPVPGDNYTAMRARGVTYGQFIGRDQREDPQWIEPYEWWYRRSFFVPESLGRDARCRLTFDGLDTLATIYLNGRKLLRHENMHTPASAEVSDRLIRGGRNVLAVRFDSVPHYGAAMGYAGTWMPPYREQAGPLVRKCQMQFSWDFHPRHLVSGIWKGVRLEVLDHPRIAGVKVLPRDVSAASARLDVELRVEGPVPAGAAVSFRVGSVSGQAPVVDGVARLSLTLRRPKLWWPWEFGTPHLYTGRARLAADGRTLHTVRQRFGVRSVAITQEPLPDGTPRWGFVINGRELPVKGANWVPPRIALSDIAAKDYRDLLELAVAGRLSMLRMWGGGIYEADAFYDLCDELGIMVWQDFMFACAIYPQTAAFGRNVREEARHVIERLANHPSVVIWCGGNETDESILWAREERGKDWPLPFGPRGDRITRGILPRVVAERDGTRPYIPSSAYTPHDPFAARSTAAGDNHDYTHSLIGPPDPDKPNRKPYWHWHDFRTRFLSEFGSAALPDMATVRQYAFAESDVPFVDPDVIFSGERTAGRLPTQEEIDVRQSRSCFLTEYKARHLRVRRPECLGMLYWKFNDPFDSGVDSANVTWMASVRYPQAAAALFYVMRRAYAPVCVVVLDEADEGAFALSVANDRLDTAAVTVELELQDFRGKVLAHWRRDVCVPACAALRVFKDLSVGPDQRLTTVFFATVRRDGDVLDRHTFYPARYFELERVDWPPCRLSVAAAGDVLEIKAGKALARWVQVECTCPGVLFEDSAFDLPAGASRTIRPILTRGLCPADVADAQVIVRAMNAPTACVDLCRLLGRGGGS